MNTQTQEALKMAIKALLTGHHHKDLCDEAVQACKEALEQPEQEPVAERFLMKDKGKSYWAYSDYDNSKDWQPLYTRPCALARMAPSWQGLKIKEIWEIVEDIEDDDGINMEEFARAIEQALKEKNYAN